jgi:hypothetical protein
MNDLNQKELIDLTGGSFGMDVGWLLGHLITGAFTTPGGTMEALAAYYFLYHPV